MKNNNICKNNSILQNWLDNPASVTAKKEAEDHIKNCDSCKADASKFQDLFNKLDKEFSPNVSDQPHPQQINNLMARIQKLPADNKISFIDVIRKFFAQNYLKFAFAVAVVFIIGILFHFSITNREANLRTPDALNKKFSIALMSVELSKKNQEGQIFIDGKLCDSKQLKSLIPGKTYTLKNNLELSLKNRSGTITLLKEAQFTFNDNIIDLKAGDIFCTFRGKHEGFAVNTIYGKITPIGTFFQLSLKDQFLKVNLFSGKLSLETATGKVKTINGKTTVYLLANGKISDKLIFEQQDQIKPRLPSVNPKKGPSSRPQTNDNNKTLLDTL